MILLDSLFNRFPLQVFIVQGKSMLPTLEVGRRMLVLKRAFVSLNVGDRVVLSDPRDARVIVKRITERKKDHYFVMGDNKKESTDSRVFGWVEKEQIIGKVIALI